MQSTEQITAAETQQHPSSFIGRRSCVDCAHLEICWIYKAIAPLFDKHPDPPINPTDLANCPCKNFLPKTFNSLRQ